MAMTSITKTVLKLSAAAVVMFGFAMFVLPPLYTLFCELTGIGLRESKAYIPAEAEVDYSRTVRIRFDSTNAPTMPWHFKPGVFEVEVHPGERSEIVYHASNTTRRDMVAQAIPSVVPTDAFDYFHKTECFCFNQQPLTAGESADLPLVFIVDRDLPAHIDLITISYTLFDITDRVTVTQNNLN